MLVDEHAVIKAKLIEHCSQIKMFIQVNNSLVQRVNDLENAIKIIQAELAFTRTRRCSCEKHS